MRPPFEVKRRGALAGFSLVETLLALGLAAGGLTVGATALASLVAQARQREEAGAASGALLTVEAEMRTWEAAEGRPEPRRWWIDRAGQRVVGLEEDPPRALAGESAAFFEVEGFPCAPDGSELPVFAGVVRLVALRVSWPVFDPGSRRVEMGHRSSRVRLLAVRPP